MTALIGIFLASMPAMSAEKHGSHSQSEGNTKGATMTPQTYKHTAVVDGIRTEFQIMSLASMNMKDPQGATHHVMLNLYNDKTNQPIKQVIGKVKVIDPAGKEQIAALKDYNGILAANFTFKDAGKYGMICLFKENGRKHVVKFWYPHQ
jgi:hypothetical protein